MIIMVVGTIIVITILIIMLTSISKHLEIPRQEYLGIPRFFTPIIQTFQKIPSQESLGTLRCSSHIITMGTRL